MNSLKYSDSFVDWTMPALLIAARIEDLLARKNPHGRFLPKFIANQRAFYIFAAHLLDTHSVAIPGTIISVSDGGIVVATITKNLLISELRTCGDCSESITQFCQRYQLNIGMTLPIISPEQAYLYQSQYEQLLPHESYWLAKLADTMPLACFKLFDTTVITHQSSFYQRIELPQIAKTKFDQLFIEKISIKKETILLTILLIYFYRINNGENYTAWVFDETETHKRMDLLGLFPVLLPLPCSSWASLSFIDCIKKVDELLSELREQLSYSQDFFFANKAQFNLNAEHCVSFNVVDSIENYQPENSFLNVAIDKNSLEIAIFSPNSSDNQDLHCFIEWLPEQIISLANALLKNPESMISEHAILSEKQANTILLEWNNTQTDYPKDKTIHELFDEQVLCNPNKIAVIYKNESITYLELQKKANQLASYFLSLKRRESNLIFFITKPGIEFIIGLLGILKAGYAYVPIDNSYPDKRIEELISCGNPAHILVDDSSFRRVCKVLEKSNFLERIVNLPYALRIGNKKNHKNLSSQPSPVPAYVIFTSGSTGVPKGCVIPHHAVIRLIKNTNYIAIEPHDNIAQIASISFDAATFEIWGALLNGATLTVFSKEMVFDFSFFKDALCFDNITIMFITTSLFNVIVQEKIDCFDKLRILLIGGETIRSSIVSRLLKHIKENKLSLSLFNVYGPTENTGFSTFHSMNEPDRLKELVPIGKPVSNTTVYIFDRFCHFLPPMIPGEIVIGGNGLQVGYFNQPDITKQSFIYSESFSDKNSLLYRSGDQGFWYSNGILGFIKRNDKQIKISGFRVELDELEYKINRLPIINESIVLPLSGSSGNLALVAFVTLKVGVSQECAMKNLQKFSRDRLSTYMRPLFYILDKFPLTENCKIDELKLLTLVHDKRDSLSFKGNENVILENKLIDVFRRLLKIDNLNTSDRFFDLGVNSLALIQACHKINEMQLAYKKITVTEMFKYPSIKDLANYVVKTTDNNIFSAEFIRVQKQKIALEIRKDRNARREG